MGLDQYLSVERAFPVDSPQADQILAAAGTTAGRLKQLSENDPYEAETYVYLSRWDFLKDKEPEKYALATRVHEAAGTLPFATTESGGGGLSWRDDKIAVHITAIYWRKANAIHAWFVDNCQGGIDECQRSEVHPEQLAQLRSVCGDALTAYNSGDRVKAGEILTPRSGFFFGSTDVDDWWAEDVQRTISEIDRVLRLAAATGGCTFWYQSSW